MQITLQLVLLGLALVHLSNGIMRKWSEFSPCKLNNPEKNCGKGEKYRECLNCPTAKIQTLPCQIWCIDNTIINKLEEFTNTFQGSGFSEWSDWTGCSESCGTGIKRQTRVCEGTSCVGDTEKTEICSKVECQLESCDDVPNGPYDINFQDCDVNNDICGNWTWGENKWIIGPSREQTKGTGPLYDTTFQKDCGKYIYFEASTASNGEFQMNDAVSTTETSCLSFNLNMYSTRPADMGSLIVMVEGSENTLFNRSGGLASRRQGWEPVKINVPKGNNLKIVFKATKGIGSRSDIALDDIVFKNDEACTTGVDGNWGSWEEWGSCSTTCGFAETSRHRYCDSPHHTNDGLPCQGNAKDTKKCEELEPCPVDGSWGEWEDWSKCTLTCGMETSQRIRSCNEKVGKGKFCLIPGTDKRQGYQMQSKECNIKPCPDTWSSWTPYTDCSSTCSDMPGIKYKSRQCKIAKDNDNSICVPENEENVKRTNTLAVEYQSKVCYVSNQYGPCIPETTTTTSTTTTTTTTTPAPEPTYTWSDWSETIVASGFFQVRVCGGGAENATCTATSEESIYSSDESVEIQNVQPTCGFGWEMMTSSTGEITCWFVSNVTVKMNFTDASADCIERGGEIASIISSDEHRFVVSLLPFSIPNTGLYSEEECGIDDHCNYWLGAIQLATNLKWEWSDGTLLGYSNYNKTNDIPGDGLIMNIQANYSWTNLDTSEERGYVCKKYLTPKRVCKDDWYRVGDNCFYMSNDNASAVATDVDAAQSICEETIVGDEHANLASVTNRDIQVFIDKYGSLYSLTKLFIGGYTVASTPGDGQLNIWRDGTYWTSFSFHYGVPSAVENIGITGGSVVNSAIGWEFVGPTTEFPYVCGYSLVPPPKCPDGWSRLITPTGIQCYYVVVGAPVSYPEAFKTCETSGAVLAKLDDYYERAFALHLVQKVKPTTYGVSIGITTHFSRERRWLDGTAVNDTVFDVTPPSSFIPFVIANAGDDFINSNPSSPTFPLCQIEYGATMYQENEVAEDAAS